MIVKEHKDMTPMLQNARNTILILCDGPKGILVHDRAVELNRTRKWRKCCLIEDLGILTQAEKDSWFGGDNTGTYAVLSGRSKKVATGGTIDRLMLPDGGPDNLEIEAAFAEGDSQAKGDK
jgi:hypothetical protein